jgi:uncharacterized protein
MTVHSSLEPPELPSQSVVTTIGVRIPLRDGLLLHAAVWRPRGQSEPVSAVMELTPYGIDHLNDDGVFWATHGFAYIAIDVRGRGNSDGEFVPFMHDALDGYDAVEWIAAQEWCDGNVALHGGSYTGINQYLILGAAPPSLKAITPDSTTGHGLDLPRGGIPLMYEFAWRRLISNRATQFSLFGDAANWHRHLFDALVAGTSLVEAAAVAGAPVDESSLETIDHAEPGSRSEAYLIQPEQLAARSVPVLSITGMYDDSSNGTIRNWRRFVDHASSDSVSRSHLVIGPWDHMGTHFGDGKVGEITFGPDATVALAQLRCNWLRHVLHGAPTPEFLADRVMFYVAGEERWRSMPRLDAATDDVTIRRLRSVDGPMDAQHAGFIEPTEGSGPDAVFACDPFDLRTHEVELQARPTGSGPESPFNGQPINSFFHVMGGNDPTNHRFVLDLDGQGVVYTSQVLTDDLTIVGTPELHLRIVCDRPDADIAALMYEITPTGDAIFLSSDMLRLSCRNLDGGHAPLVPGEATDIHLRSFKWCARRVRAGSRLELAVRHAYSIQVTPYAHGRPADAAVANVRILHGAVDAPRLVLPIGA